MLRNQTKNLVLPVLVALVYFFASGCSTQPVVPDVAEEIPDGANTIILEKESLTEVLDTDAAALSYFVDLRQHFENNGFQIENADEDALIITTQPNTIEDGIVMRFEAKVEPIAGGSRVVVMPMYTPGPGNPWARAAWTSGLQQRAFAEAFSMMGGLSHSDMGVTEEDLAVNE